MSIKCSFSAFVPSIECGKHSSYNKETTIVPLATCQKDISSHLRRIHVPKDNVSSEMELILLRSGKFKVNELSVDEMTVCPSHRYKLGLCWRRPERCKHPLHLTNSLMKPDRSGVKLLMSEEVHHCWKILLPVGSGVCKSCADKHKAHPGVTEFQKRCTEHATMSQPQPSTSTLSTPQLTTVPPSNVPLPKQGGACAFMSPPAAESTPSTEQSSTQMELDIATFPQPDFDSDSNNGSSGTEPIESVSQETLLETSQEYSLEASWAPTPAPSKSEIRILNNFLTSTGREPLRGQLKMPLEDAAPSTVRYYKTKAQDTISLVLNLMAPSQEKKLMDLVLKPEQLEKEAGDGLFKQLIDCYNQATSWQTKRQILSILVEKHSRKDLIDIIPGLTKYRFDQARKHVKEVGPAQPVNIQAITRCRLDDSLVDHFLDFICRPEFTQDVAYGTKNMKLSHGEVLEIPNVVRTVISSRLIDLYVNYCSELNVKSLGRTTLYNILHVCASSKKVALAGLDNIAAEGAHGFATLHSISKTLSELGLTGSWLTDVKNSLQSAQLYLKTDFKMNLAISSPYPDHCMSFALSSDTKTKCSHDHNNDCSNCDNIRSVIKQIESGLSDPIVKFSYPNQKDELLYEFENSKNAVENYKAHIVRALNQERAKTDILNNLKNNECFVTMDWAMKFLPTRFREAQQDWFAKKGISWHITAIVTKSGSDFDIHCFVHFINKCTQNWYSVLCVFEASVEKMKELMPVVKVFYVRSDNAGCYHCAPLILSLPQVAKRQKVKIRNYDFSEAQAGKDICDRKIASLKAHIQRYINEGHDVTTAKEMYDACMSYNGVRGCYCSEMKIDESGMSERLEWAGITSWNNFQFEANGVRVWKAYKMETGTLHENDKLYKNGVPNEKPIYTVTDYTTPQVLTGTVQSHSSDKDSCRFPCTEEGCKKSFRTENQLTRHLSVGRHDMEPVMDTKYDAIKRKWQSRVGEVVSHQHLPQPSTSTAAASEMTSVDIPVSAGWALRTAAKRKTYSEDVKKFLVQQFMIGVNTGKKEDPVTVAKRLKGKFAKKDWLSSRQIASYFSRLASLQKCGRLNIDVSQPSEADDAEECEIVRNVLERRRLRSRIIAEIDE